jgi:hypothetical protein
MQIFVPRKKEKEKDKEKSHWAAFQFFGFHFYYVQSLGSKIFGNQNLLLHEAQ